VNEPRKAKLTNRELEIIKLMANGFLAKEIAEKLKISIRTVQSHNVRIYIKLGARNKMNAVAIFMRSLHN